MFSTNKNKQDDTDERITITVYLSRKQKDLIQKAADQENRSISNFVRHTMTELAKQKVDQPNN